MGRPGTRPRNRIEDRFDLHDDAVPGRREALRAAQYRVTDRKTGREGSLKLWRKTGTAADEDLRTLWAHEMRQVQRVLSHAGARDVIVGVITWVEAEDEFGLLLDHSGQTLTGARRLHNHWLNRLSDPVARKLLWRNFRRVAKALSIIHGQGLIHGALDGDAVMTESATEPDFQVTGFEWSLHVKGEVAAVGREGRGAVAPCSFSGDWNALGTLAATCLDVDVAASGEITNRTDGRDLHLSEAEVTLLRQLVNPIRGEGLEAQGVIRSIDDAIASTGTGSASGTARLLLTFGRNSNLAEVVAEVTGNGIAIDESNEQLEWARGELGNGARLLVNRGEDGQKYRLFTASMVLSLSASAAPDGASVWTAARCWKAEVRKDDASIGDADEYDVHVPIEVVGGERQLDQRRAALGPSALDWRDLARPASAEDIDPLAARVQDALVLAQAADAIVQALEAHPVDVITARVEDGRRRVLLRATARSQRDAFANRLKLSSSEESLVRMFEDDERNADGKWRLSRSSMLGTRLPEDVTATFFDLGEDKGRSGYWFEVDDEVPSDGQWFLRPENEAGTGEQILRRLRAIRALGERVDLGRMLGDPWRERRTSGKWVDEEQRDDAFDDLDEAKQKALVALWTTEPSFFVVGPPGVGKTHLLTEVVRRRFSADPPPRILLTAQGHDALDHLQGKVRTALDGAGHGDAIMVRSDATQRSTGLDATPAAGAMLARLAGSRLVAAAPPPLAEKARRLARLTLAGTVESDEDRSALRAATGTVLSAADVVVTTANSGDVERLVEAHEQFDWVIVEEAAKATGPEMTGPLMLSGRRLLIGDHNQLSPFGADRVRLLLADHSLVAEAVRDAEQWIGGLMRNGELDDLREVAADDARLKATADLAARFATPFEAFVTEDEARMAGSKGSKPISAVLTEQRRMDPAIARIVSKAFYGGKLTTEKQRAKEAAEGDLPCECIGTLPASPVVVIECGHVSGSGSEEPKERTGPRYHNPGEVAATVGVLERLRPRPDKDGKAPSLAVLSFYGAQVEKIDAAIATAQVRGRLPELSGFRPAVCGKYVGTVDAFQGQEADVVILSLVRNNPRTGTGALGFLRESRRMNVALSRAEGKLVIVGSLRFLAEAARGVNPRGRPHDLSFLTRVAAAVAKEMKATARPNVPCAVEISPSDLFGEPAPC